MIKNYNDYDLGYQDALRDCEEDFARLEDELDRAENRGYARGYEAGLKAYEKKTENQE